MKIKMKTIKILLIVLVLMLASSLTLQAAAFTTYLDNMKPLKTDNDTGNYRHLVTLTNGTSKVMAFYNTILEQTFCVVVADYVFPLERYQLKLNIDRDIELEEDVHMYGHYFGEKLEENFVEMILLDTDAQEFEGQFNIRLNKNTDFWTLDSNWDFLSGTEGQLYGVGLFKIDSRDQGGELDTLRCIELVDKYVPNFQLYLEGTEAAI